MSPDPTPPAQDQRAASDAHISPNARLGLVLFTFYLSLYIGFMLIAAFKRQWFEKPILLGVNLAIVYGMGLIFAALFLSIIYMKLCKRDS